MKIYKKTTILIMATIMGLVVILYAASAGIILGGFSGVEENNAHENADRMVNALVNDINTLDTLAFELASREETRTFLSVKSVRYLPYSDNSVLEQLGINFIVIKDPSGRVRAEKGFDLETESEISVPLSFMGHLSTPKPLVGHDSPDDSVMGLLMIPEGALMVASRPVLGYDNQQVIGTVIMGKYLNNQETNRLSRITNMPVVLLTAEDITGQTEYNDLFSNIGLVTGSFMKLGTDDIISINAPVEISLVDDRTIAAYSLVRDIYGTPALIMKTTMPRDIYGQGQKITLYFILYIFAGGLIIGTMFILMLERSVLSRLSFLNTHVGKIGRKKDFSARVSMKGDDEVSLLASSINGMLAQLEDQQLNLQNKLSQTEERYRLFFNTGNDAILIHTINRDGTPARFIEANEAACRMLGYYRHEFLRVAPFKILTDDGVAQNPEVMKRLLEDAQTLYETDFISYEGKQIPVEINAHLFEHMGRPAVLSMARDITERRETERLKMEAFRQIEQNMEQFAILNDHLRNPLQVIVGLSLLNGNDEKMTSQILEQAEIINDIVHQLDQGWIQSEKIRDWLRKYYEFEQ